MGRRGLLSRGRDHGGGGGARARASEGACGRGLERARGHARGCARRRHVCSRGGGWASRHCGCAPWRGECARGRGHARGHGSGRGRACGCCLQHGRVCGGGCCFLGACGFFRDDHGSWCGRARGRARGRVSVSGR